MVENLGMNHKFNKEKGLAKYVFKNAVQISAFEN